MPKEPIKTPNVRKPNAPVESPREPYPVESPPAPHPNDDRPLIDPVPPDGDRPRM